MPVLEPYLGGRIDITEARPQERTARNLDIDAGFDALCRTQQGTIALANRVQWTTRTEIIRRPCPVCGEITTSASKYFCANCHFGGWWGRWK